MATATKAAQSDTAATETAVAQVTETVAATVSKATSVANDLITHTTDALAPVVRSAEAKTAELTEAFAGEVKKAEAKTAELTEAFTAEVKKAEAKTAELTEAFTAEVKKAEAKTREWTETFAAEAKKAAAQSFDTYQKAVQRYLDVTIEFIDTWKNEAVSDLTRRNAKAVTDMVDASVGQAHDLLK